MKVETIANYALERMQKAGFDDAQVSVTISEKNELNIQHNEPSLLRSTEDRAISLTGFVDSRKANMALTDLAEGVIDTSIDDLFERAKLAPQDDANAVSQNQVQSFSQGPGECDLDLLAQKAEELLSWRAEHTPSMQIEEGAATYSKVSNALMTSQGSRIDCELGSYSLTVMGTASDGENSSSFNYTGGRANDLSQSHAAELFGIGEMLKETERQIHTESYSDKFVGDIVLAPTAVGDLLGWLLGQLQDFALISDTSLYKDSVGGQIANAMLTVTSRFDAPGHAAYTGDGFIAEPLTLIDQGKLTTLIPSLYASNKTGITHRPASSGWAINPGSDAKNDLIAGIGKGALVNRLSMGSPAANGDFSGVIKNSFKIENGSIGGALSETMIAGNMSNMLNDIVGISQEHLDLGGEDFPWIRIAGLNFS